MICDIGIRTSAIITIVPGTDRGFFILSFSRATSAAHGGSQARGRIGAAAAGLHHSPNSTGSEAHPKLQLSQILNPLSKARDKTLIFMDTSRVCYR